MREELQGLLSKQGYGFAGEHGGVKLCHWTKEDLKEDGRHCYKGDFYGVDSHRCMQMTPVVDYCNFRCLYCWRSQDFDYAGPRVWDPPSTLLLDAIKEQRRLISGYKGKDTTSMEKWIRAHRPKHVAISLNGEPTVYPHLAEFIKTCHQHGMTTMVVTNGSFPEAIEKLAELDGLPSQLYVSLDAPNEEVFNKLCVPLTGGAWDKLNRTLEIMADLDCRTVCRITSVKGWNMGFYDEYAQLIEKADPTFVEVKGYVWVGYSRERMKEENMPSHGDIRQFAQRLSEEIGYSFEAERADSRVALLVKPGAERKLPEYEDESPITLEGEDVPNGIPAEHRREAEAILPMAGQDGMGCGCTGH
ncbi:MAG: 4-demethylwyosine synthase TYW1 [Candidatus Thermoplasmatota archaeon]|nr:4-demethylwyosine synthase TYW1 [Candidatus Thermoplasmatota archaeon]